MKKYQLKVTCYNFGMKYHYAPVILNTLSFYKDRVFNHPVTPENLEYFKSLPGNMYAYPYNPEFGISKLSDGDTPLYTNGECRVDKIELIEV